MSTSVNPLPSDFEPTSAHSIAQLNNLLTQCGSLYYDADATTGGQWTTSKNVSKASMTHEKFVIVGQAINVSTLHKILTQYFPDVALCEISLHPLHEVFPQQALVLTVFHEQSTVLVNTELLQTVSYHFFIDCFAVSPVELKQGGLLVMDMDSTIINMECIDEIAALAGLGDKVSALTERAMQGELDFNQSLYARVGCLEGIKLSALDDLKSRLPVNSGFAQTMAILQQYGWTTVIASGGFTYFANYLRDSYQLSAAFSNTLGLSGDALNGEVEGRIVNGEIKREILLQQAQLSNVSLSQTVAIGDGANDLLMMDAAALGIAYKAKPTVKAQADASIQYCGFEGLLYCLAQ